MRRFSVFVVVSIGFPLMIIGYFYIVCIAIDTQGVCVGQRVRCREDVNRIVSPLFQKRQDGSVRRGSLNEFRVEGVTAAGKGE
jgi:hypothetical protein